jgi:hypothetical protein
MNVDTSADGSYWRAILFEDMTSDWKEKGDDKYSKFLKRECRFERSDEN